MSTFDMASLVFIFAALIGIVNERYFRWPRVITLLMRSSWPSDAVSSYATSRRLMTLAATR